MGGTNDHLVKVSAQAIGSGPGEPTTTSTSTPTSTSTTTTTAPPPVEEPLAFSTGWASQQTGWFSGGEATLGFGPFLHTEAANGSAPQHVMEQDSVSGTSTVRISQSIELVGGRTYTFTFESLGFSSNDVKQTVTASIGGRSLTFSCGTYTPAV